MYPKGGGDPAYQVIDKEEVLGHDDIKPTEVCDVWPLGALA